MQTTMTFRTHPLASLVVSATIAVGALSLAATSADSQAQTQTNAPAKASAKKSAAQASGPKFKIGRAHV